MGFYEFFCGFMGALCVALKVLEHVLSLQSQTHSTAPRSSTRDSAAYELTRKYLIPYGLAMGADWLQGPYAYSLYTSYGYSEKMISYFFITGFASAAMFAPLIGTYADLYGRKHVCLAYCIMYASSCTLLQVPWLPCILLARILGGISTSILFSAFESWLVTAHAEAALPPDSLSSILGHATLLNGLIAAVAGVFSNELIEYTDKSYRSPFIVSALVLVLAFVAVSGLWSENYGSIISQTGKDSVQLTGLVQAARIVVHDPVLVSLGITQTLFEGSMYLFVFVWVPTLLETSIAPAEDLPLGYIFSTLMFSMMLGSLAYTFLTAHIFRPASKESSLVLHATLSAALCAVAAFSLAVCVNVGPEPGATAETLKYWAFCLFEACVGMYYPVQGVLKGNLIFNEHRATMSSLFRVPQNVLVVVALATGFSSGRDRVLFACSLLLAFSALVSALVLLPRLETTSTPRETHPVTPMHPPETPASAQVYTDTRVGAPYAGAE